MAVGRIYFGHRMISLHKSNNKRIRVLLAMFSWQVIHSIDGIGSCVVTRSPEAYYEILRIQLHETFIESRVCLFCDIYGQGI